MRFAKIQKNLKQEKKEKDDEHRFFENILKPLQDINIDGTTSKSKKPSEHDRGSSRDPTPVISLKCNTNDNVVLDKKESRIGYKVLAIKDNGFGRKIIFDLLDGTVYNCSFTNKVTKFVPLFDNKSAAMNERCNPYKVYHSLFYYSNHFNFFNQCIIQNDHTGIDKSKCPRILASFGKSKLVHFSYIDYCYHHLVFWKSDTKYSNRTFHNRGLGKVSTSSRRWILHHLRVCSIHQNRRFSGSSPDRACAAERKICGAILL